MFFVRDLESGDGVFTDSDPRDDGCKMEVVEGVTLDPYDLMSLCTTIDGDDQPDLAVGYSETDPKHHRVFRTQKDMRGAGYLFAANGRPWCHPSWAAYLESKGRAA